MTVKLITAPASETDCQMTVIAWSQIARAKYPELALLHHIPNGGSRNKAEAERLKKSGVKSGVPDLFLPVPRRGYHGAYIEMKRPKPKGRVSDEQKWWAKRLTEQGYFWRVCYGAQEAQDTLEWYLGDGSDGSKLPAPLPKGFDQW